MYNVTGLSLSSLNLNHSLGEVPRMASELDPWIFLLFVHLNKRNEVNDRSDLVPGGSLDLLLLQLHDHRVGVSLPAELHQLHLTGLRRAEVGIGPIVIIKV